MQSLIHKGPFEKVQSLKAQLDKILLWACFYGQVVCPRQILSESDEPDPSYCKNINFAGSSTFSFPPLFPVTKQFYELSGGS